MDFQIKHAELADAPTIAKFQVAMALETENKALDPVVVERAVGKVFGDPMKGFYLVAKGDVGAAPNETPSSSTQSNCEVLGSLLITYEWSDWRDSFIWYIQSVYVDKRVRGQGIFRKLYHQVIEMAKDQDVMYVRLFVETDNQRAQGIYESLGMKRLPYFMYDVSLGSKKE